MLKLKDYTAILRARKKGLSKPLAGGVTLRIAASTQDGIEFSGLVPGKTRGAFSVSYVQLYAKLTVVNQYPQVAV